MSIEAMKQALEALYLANTRQWPENKIGAAINALSAAIEQAEKQPAQRTWVGLTDAEIEEWDYEVRDVVMDIEKLLREKNT
jgi:hypothetical protein